MLLADHHCFGVLAHGIHQHIGMGGDDQLGSFRGFQHVIGQLGQHVGMQAELGFIDADQRRRIGVAEDRQQAEIAFR